MTRTNIDIDDELVETVMKQNHLKTKREAVDFALHQAVRKLPTREELLALRGIGWPMSNEEIEGDEGGVGVGRDAEIASPRTPTRRHIVSHLQLHPHGSTHPDVFGAVERR